jgi:phage shock protein PspC (stress-responsive transcriptional regulator)
MAGVRRFEHDGDMANLSRPRTGRIFGGVAAGLARRFSISPTLVRALFIISCLLPGPQFIVYIALWIVLPSEEETTRLVG